jgi:hypothetical protein
MSKRILWLAGLGILLAQGVLLCQAPPSATPGVPEPAKTDELQVKIVNLAYYPARDLAALLNTLSSGERTLIVVDGNMNRLIVRATKARMEELLHLIAALDVPTNSAPQSPPLLCRVYVAEIPPKESNLKPFVVVLRTILPVSSPEVLNATKGDDLRIGRVLQRSDGVPEGEQRIVIEGLASSNEAIKRMIEAIPKSQIADLRWDDDTFTTSVPAAQVAQLPAPLQQHLHKFLGTDVRTVGYWFGSFSSDGKVEAPIGLWTLLLKSRPAQAGDLQLEVHVTHNPQYSMDRETTVLSNSVQAKIGKPIIIGYNRDAYGVRTMGAMVILLEPDTAQPSDAPASSPKP